MTKSEKNIAKDQAVNSILISNYSTKRKAKELAQVIKKYKVNGILWQKAISEIDNKTPIISIITNCYERTSNDKIGNMLQIWYFVDYKNFMPFEIAKQGLDQAVCGNCKHRPTNFASCYVTLFHSARAVFKAYKDNNYIDLTDEKYFKILLELIKFLDLPVRFGAYGDPAALPLKKQLLIAENSPGFTGYTHQWKDSKFSNFKQLLAASVDNEDELNIAKTMGWNWYRIEKINGLMTGKNGITEDGKNALKLLKTKGEAICPNTMSNGLIDCANCLKCSGLTSKNARSIVNGLHGARVKKYLAS